MTPDRPQKMTRERAALAYMWMLSLAPVFGSFASDSLLQQIVGVSASVASAAAGLMILSVIDEARNLHGQLSDARALQRRAELTLRDTESERDIAQRMLSNALLRLDELEAR